MLAKADYLASIGDMPAALQAYKETEVRRIIQYHYASQKCYKLFKFSKMSNLSLTNVNYRHVLSYFW